MGSGRRVGQGFIGGGGEGWCGRPPCGGEVGGGQGVRSIGRGGQTPRGGAHDVEVGAVAGVLQAVLGRGGARVGAGDEEEVVVADGGARGEQDGHKGLAGDDLFVADVAHALGPRLVLQHAPPRARGDERPNGALHVEHAAAARVGVRDHGQAGRGGGDLSRAARHFGGREQAQIGLAQLRGRNLQGAVRGRAAGVSRGAQARRAAGRRAGQARPRASLGHAHRCARYKGGLVTGLMQHDRGQGVVAACTGREPGERLGEGKIAGVQGTPLCAAAPGTVMVP